MILNQRIIRIFGLDASRITSVLDDCSRRFRRVNYEVQHSLLESHIVIKPLTNDTSNAVEDMDRVEKEIREFAGAHVFACDDSCMEGVVGKLLKKSKLTLSVAESCTGGLIGSRLTDISGSSSYFSGGVIVYCNQAKVDLLGVSNESLKAYGAVSGQVAREMAKGVRNKLHSDIGISVTGIAGPDGGSLEKPVGTVFIGLATGFEAFSEGYLFHGTRSEIKAKSSSMALDWVRRYLNGDKVLPGIQTT